MLCCLSLCVCLSFFFLSLSAFLSVSLSISLFSLSFSHTSFPPLSLSLSLTAELVGPELLSAVCTLVVGTAPADTEAEEELREGIDEDRGDDTATEVPVGLWGDVGDENSAARAAGALSFRGEATAGEVRATNEERRCEYTRGEGKTQRQRDNRDKETHRQSEKKEGRTKRQMQNHNRETERQTNRDTNREADT